MDTATSLTLGEFFTDHRAEILDTQELASNTISAYERAWAKRLQPLAAAPLASITPRAIHKLHRTWDCAPSTKHDALALLSRICNVAILEGSIAQNPVRSMPKQRRKLTEQQPTVRALSRAQVDRMLTLTADHPRAQRTLACMVYTGARLGEATALDVSDIGDRTITITRTASPDGHGRMTVGAPKSRRSRVVPILPDFRPYLDAALADHIEGRLFTGAGGGYFDSGNLSRALVWPKIRDSIKRFPPESHPLRFHDLRHTAAVEFFALGLSAPDVQRILGHSSLQVTELYSRSGDDAALRAVDAAENR